MLLRFAPPHEKKFCGKGSQGNKGTNYLYHGSEVGTLQLKYQSILGVEKGKKSTENERTSKKLLVQSLRPSDGWAVARAILPEALVGVQLLESDVFRGQNTFLLLC